MVTSATLTTLPRWEQVAKSKQHDREISISQWATKVFGTTTPRLPPQTSTNVRQWPFKSGHLTQCQLEITSSTPVHILKQIRARLWTAEEVFIAFSVCATIAHYLTNPFTETFFDEGLVRARELDQHLARTGQTVGCLHGLPMSLKDVMSVKGHVTTLGFVALADNVRETSDELIVHLYNAGAVFYCKTNVPQSLMSGECNNHLYGRTSTPDNLTLSAGGSSGGEGSLIALRGSPLGIGTDIAGSIRTPANFNGIYGLCPTYGRLPCHSAENSPISLINGVAGPISSSIDGLELYVRAVLSFEPWKWDASCVNLPWNESIYQATKGRASTSKLCFGFVANDGVVRPHPPIERGMRETKEALIKAGHEVIDVDFLRADDRLWDLAVRIFCADGGKALREMLNLLPEPPVKEIIVPPASMALAAWELEEQSKLLLQVRQKLLLRWQNTEAITPTGRPIDVLILPSGGHVAPPHSTMEYWLYEAISNIADWTCATIPVGNVDPALDLAPGPDDDFISMSDEDRKNWDKYSPEAYANGAICLQVLGPRFSEEVVLASMRVIDEALGRGPDTVL